MMIQYFKLNCPSYSIVFFLSNALFTTKLEERRMGEEMYNTHTRTRNSIRKQKKADSHFENRVACVFIFFLHLIVLQSFSDDHQHNLALLSVCVLL